MNEIIESIIQWYEENHITPDIHFYSELGGIWLRLKLSKGKYCIAREFYIPNGVLCVENWRRGYCDKELELFLKDAKEGLEKAKESKNGQV